MNITIQLQKIVQRDNPHLNIFMCKNKGVYSQNCWCYKLKLKAPFLTQNIFIPTKIIDQRDFTNNLTSKYKISQTFKLDQNQNLLNE